MGSREIQTTYTLCDKNKEARVRQHLGSFCVTLLETSAKDMPQYLVPINARQIGVIHYTNIAE